MDPFGMPFGPMAPACPVTSPSDPAAPPLPPRPKRRPVPTNTEPPRLPPRPSFPPPPLQTPQLVETGGGLPCPPTSAPSYFVGTQAANYSPRCESEGFVSVPKSEKPEKSHSFLSSPGSQLAASIGLEWFSPGLSSVLWPIIDRNNPTKKPISPSSNNHVVVNGVTLGQADLLSLQTMVGYVYPGSYWYDRRSGAYGRAQQPCMGFLAPFLALGGAPLAPDASGKTRTGVFINGREIHSLDVAQLLAIGTPVMPGRWWLDADGSYGAEGSSVICGSINRQALASGGGNAHSWSTNMGHYGGSDGQGFSYVGGPGWSYDSG